MAAPTTPRSILSPTSRDLIAVQVSAAFPPPPARSGKADHEDEASAAAARGASANRVGCGLVRTGRSFSCASCKLLRPAVRQLLDLPASPVWYSTNPSGTFWQCNAKVIGSGSEGADSSLQGQYNKDQVIKEQSKSEGLSAKLMKLLAELREKESNLGRGH